MQRRWFVLGGLLLAIGCAQADAPQDAPPRTAEEALNLGNDLMTKAYGTDAILESNPDYAAMTQVDPNHRQEAISMYDEAIRLDPNHAEAYYRRGFAELAREEPEKAIGDLTEAIKLNPDDARAYLMRSRAYEALGDMERSQQDREEALRLDPSLGS